MTAIIGTYELSFSGSWGILESNPGNDLADLKVQRIVRVQKSEKKYVPINSIWIPGTSLKGTLRSVASRIDPNACKTAHTSSTNKSCIKGKSCKVCSLFGNFDREGKLRLSSTFIDEAHIIVQPHLAVNRKKKSAASGALFHTEKISTSKFRIEITAKDITEDEFRLLRGALKLWGNFGLGRKHLPFKILAIEELSEIKKKEFFR